MTGFLSYLADANGPSFWMPIQASDFAVNVDALFYFIYYLSVFFFVVLMGATGYFAWKYKKSPENRRSHPLSHNFRLEFMWSAIPTVLLVVIFAWGFRDFTALSAQPTDTLRLRVVGQKWSWSVAYPQYDRECTSEAMPDGSNIVKFYVQQNRPFTVQMSSNDVLHSFWIPAFRVKRDVLPNRYTGFTVTPTVPGKYPLYCAEYCGTSHSDMKGEVIVLTPEEWEKEFVNSDKCKLDPKDPAYKPKLFSKLGCNACHAVTAEGGPSIGPRLFGLAAKGTSETNAGTVTVDENYLRESLELPQAKIVKGYEGASAMPSFRGRVTEDELNAIIEYVQSLK